MAQDDPVAAVGDHGAFGGAHLDGGAFSDGLSVLAQPLPQHGPVLLVVRRGNPERSSMVERGMQADDVHGLG